MSPFMRHPQKRHDLILSLLHGQFIRTFIDCQPPRVLEFSPFIPNVDKGLWRALKCFLRPKASNLSAGNLRTFIASQDLCVIVSPPSLNPTFFFIFCKTSEDGGGLPSILEPPLPPLLSFPLFVCLSPYRITNGTSQQQSSVVRVLLSNALPCFHPLLILFNPPLFF